MTILGFLLTATACSKSNDKGAAALEVQIRALSAAQIASVRATVTAPDISPPIVAELTVDAAGAWRGTISGIPAGPARLFTVEAFDSAGQLLYTGSSQADVPANQTVQVVIILQQAQPPTPFRNSAPYITSVVASTTRISPGSQVDLRVTAVDPDGDPLDYQWTGDGGGFVGGSAGPGDGGVSGQGAAVTWTAPALAGTYHLTIKVSDPRNATTSVTLAVAVTSTPGLTGSVVIEARVNTWPEISSVASEPGQCAPGDALVLHLVASDPDNDPLAYAWQSSCAGTFNSTAAQEPAFVLSTESADTSCTFTVDVTDGRGGASSGQLVVHVGAAITPTLSLLAASPQTGLITTELNQGTATFMVWLKGPPTADVVIAVSSSDTGEGTVAPATLTFTTDDWSVPQIVTVTGVDDGVDDGDQDYAVRIGPVTSDDPIFAALSPVLVSLTNQDPSAVHLTHPTLVSVSTTGGQGNRDSYGARASANSRFVAFTSAADNLVPGDLNGGPDVFVRDVLLGVTQRVSVGTLGAEANGVSTLVDISADGRYVLFNSSATNLVDDDTNGFQDVFVRDRQTGITQRVSVGPPANLPDGGVDAGTRSDGAVTMDGGRPVSLDAGVPPPTLPTGDAAASTQAPFDLYGISLSPGGRYVLMGAGSNTYDPVWQNGGMYLHDLATHQTRLLPSSYSYYYYNQNPYYFSPPSLWSSDDRFVFYPGGYRPPQYPIWRLDLTTWTETRVDVAVDGTPANSTDSSYRSLSVSADGTLVAFASDASNLVPNDTNGEVDIFVKNMATGQVVRASVASAGEQSVGNNLTISDYEYNRGATISADGRYVVFHSNAYNLVPDDTNHQTDLFLRDLAAARTVRPLAPSTDYPYYYSWTWQPRFSVDSRLLLVTNIQGNNSSRSYYPSWHYDIAAGSVKTTRSAWDMTSNGRLLVFTSFDDLPEAGDSNLVQDVIIAPATWSRP